MGSVGPTWPAGQAGTAIIPSPQGPGGSAGTAALTRPWAPATSGPSQPASGCSHVRAGSMNPGVHDDIYLPLGILGRDCCCLPSFVQLENPCVPVPISTPASSLSPGPCHPHTLPASTLRDSGTTQHRGPEFIWVLYFFKMHFTFFFFLIKLKELKLNHGPSS